MDFWIFIISGIICLVFSAMMIFIRKALYVNFAMMFSLMGLSGLYLSLGADFLCLTQLFFAFVSVIVVMIFILMFESGKRTDRKIHWKLLFGVLLIVLTGTALVYVSYLISIKPVGGLYVPQETLQKIGELLLGEYIFPFEIMSLLLVSTMIGALVVARPDKNRKAGRSE